MQPPVLCAEVALVGLWAGAGSGDKVELPHLGLAVPLGQISLLFCRLGN